LWKDRKEIGGISDGRFDGREHPTISLEASVEMRGSDVEHVLNAVLAIVTRET
jgi:hypothetical protein